MQFSGSFGEGLIARMTKDVAKANSAFLRARAEQEKIVASQPNYGPALCVLALIDAGLGRKEEALREGRHAIELMPAEKEQVNGAHIIELFAVIAAWVGEKDLACEQLALALQYPIALGYGQLKLLPSGTPFAVIHASRKSSRPSRRKIRAPARCFRFSQSRTPSFLALAMLTSDTRR
jgi:hypothetical protein